MTEREAWLEIAEKWATPVRCPICPDGWVAAAGDEQSHGLCGSLEMTKSSQRAENRLARFAPREGMVPSDGLFWSGNREGANQRMWAALFLAAMCK